jgi:aspartate kinase
MIVMKFGGTSVAAAGPIRLVGQIVRRYAARRPVVVVSALAGVTDELMAAAAAAAAGKRSEVRRRIDRLAARHGGVARRFGFGARERAAMQRELDRDLAELRDVLHGVTLLREPSRRSLDLVASFGERLASHLVAAHLRQTGLDGRAVDARNLIVTDDGHGAAVVDLAATGVRTRALLRPMLRRGAVPVVTGYIGRTRQGATTTLGRSGSDYTAALVGEALRAREVWIWKEVDGVCTADPGVVPGARVVPRISYQEAAEMAHFGAEVIHPKTMQPVRRAGIPIRIKNTFRPGAPGTVIGARPAGGRGALMVSSMSGMSLVTIEGEGIFGQPGMVMRLLAPVAQAGANIYMISMSSSEYNISFALRQEDVERTMKALASDFRQRGLLGAQVARVVVERGMAAVAVVGAGMKGQRGIAGRIFSALGERGVNVVAIAQGSSEYNITVIVKERHVRTAVRAIHERLNGSGAARRGARPKSLSRLRAV